MDSLTPTQRPRRHRQPLSDTTEWVNNQLSTPPATLEPYSTPHIPHHTSLKTGGNLQMLDPSSPGSYAEDKRVSAVSGSERNTNRDSQISATSTDASKKSRRKRHVGPWLLGKTLGKGASGRVRVAKHVATGQKAAIKIVSKKAAELLRTDSLATMDTIAAQNGQRLIPFGIEREVVIMKLIEHPNIIKLYDVWENRGELYLVLEYIEGGELFHYISRNSRLPEHEAVRIFRQMIAGLSYCHRFHICHRDLKPENILMDRNGNIKIVDFGMAALQPANKWLTTSCGSPHYASPEVIQAQNYRGDRADIWSSGIILYAMLTGTLPFDCDGDHRDVIKLVLAGQYSFPEGLSVHAKDLIWRMLQYDPRQRIPMKKMWEHPLLRRYESLDAMDINGKPYIGPPNPLTINDCGPPIKDRKDIDRELLRNLQNLWHRVTEEEVAQNLLSDAPNHERVLYTKLLRFREEHLENYEGPVMEYSTSDYHHTTAPAQPCSTSVSLQPPLPSTKQSRYSILNEDTTRKTQSQSHKRQPSAAETEQSYDPFRAFSKRQMTKSEVDQARITILRGASAASRQRPPSVYSRRLTSHSSVRNPALARVQDEAAYSLPASSSSSGSPQQRKMPRGASKRSLATTSSAVRKSMSHKRNVSFVHPRRRSLSINHSTIRRKRESNALTLQEIFNQTAQSEERKQTSSFAADSPGPEIHQVVRSRKTPSKKPLVPDVTFTRASQYWREDTRKVSTELEKFCDEAFNRSSLQLSTTPVTEADHQTHTAATSLSVREDSTVSIDQHKQLPKVKSQIDPKPLRERPLPELPPSEHPGIYEFNQRELAKARELLLQRAADPSIAGSLDEVIAHLDRLMQPSAVRIREQERRAASTPDPKSSLERTNDTFERFLEKGYTGLRAASEPSTSDRHRATLRMVENDNKPISPTKPLTIRKKSGSSTPSSDSGRPRARTSLEPMAYHEDSKPYHGTHGTEYRAAALNLIDNPLEPIEEDEDKENFDPKDRKQKMLSGESKKRSWFRRYNQAQESLGNDKAPQAVSQAQFVSQPLHDCQALRESDDIERIRIGHRASDEAKTRQKSNGKGRFFNIFGKRVKRGKKAAKSTLGDYGLDDSESFETITSSRQHHSAYMTGALPNPSSTTVQHTRKTTDDTGASVPPPRVIQPQPQNWLARFLRIKPAMSVICFQISKTRARKEVASIFREWRKYGLRDIVIDKTAGRIWARVAEKNSLHIRPVSFAAEFFTVLEHGRKANLAIARFTQEKGAKSSFERVMEALENVLCDRGCIVEDLKKSKGMKSVLGV